MKLIPLRTLLLALLLGNGLCAADNPPPKPQPKQATPEEIMARLAEHAREKAEKDATEAPAPQPAAAETKAKSDAKDAVTVMPQFTVSSSRISELDIEIKKLDKQIERQKKKVKPSELDESLNSDQTPKALLIFGGKTAGQRKSVEADRLTFLEAERDILEAMKHVRTKKEQEQLETQLNAFKTMSRELDETLR